MICLELIKVALDFAARIAWPVVAAAALLLIMKELRGILDAIKKRIPDLTEAEFPGGKFTLAKLPQVGEVLLLTDKKVTDESAAPGS